MKDSSLYIFGKNPVEELFTDRPDLIRRIYVKETIDQSSFDHIRSTATPHRIPVIKVPEKKIKELVGEVSHQGIVADVKEFPYQDIHEWIKSLDMTKNPVVFVLNELTDPHNVGAILRSAAAFNVAGVLLPKNRQVGVNGTVYKSSAGAAHKVSVVQIGNTNNAIDVLKKAGFWIAGLSGGKHATSLYDEEFTTPLAFVIGSEGSGMRVKTEELCDYIVSIPMNDSVESLNASVAAALVGYEAQRKVVK